MGSKQILLIFLILVVLVLGGYLYYRSTAAPAPPSAPVYTNTEPPPPQSPPEPQPQPQLTKETALFLLKDKLWTGDCRPGRVEDSYISCTLEITKASDSWLVTATYNGLFDDSVTASRIQATITYRNGQWLVGQVSETHRCHVGRGHQDFSTEPCV